MFVVIAAAAVVVRVKFGLAWYGFGVKIKCIEFTALDRSVFLSHAKLFVLYSPSFSFFPINVLIHIFID